MGERFRVVFTDGTSGTNHLQLLRTLIDAATGSIRFVMSHFDDSAEAGTLRQALVDRSANGVDVRGIVRDDATVAAFPPWVATPHGCFGTRIHTKLLLFSATAYEGAPLENVAVLGSFTLSKASIAKHQNALCIADGALHASLVAHWDAMRALSGGSVTNSSKEVFSSDKRAKAYLFPYTSGDPVLNVLNNFHGRSRTIGGEVERPLARIAMARWSAGRAGLLEAIEKKLWEGVRFRVVVRAGGDDGIDPSLLSRLAILATMFPNQYGTGKASLHLGVGKVGGGWKDVHSKYLTYKGFYGEGPEWERLVWTGSENWTEPALRSNDEILVKVRDDATYEAYAANHSRLIDAVT